MGTIKVGTAEVGPGEIGTGRIPVTNLAAGAAIDIPVIVINGARDGPCLWIDGVIHGDEPEGTLTCHILRREIDPRTLAGSVVDTSARRACDVAGPAGLSRRHAGNL